MTKLDLKSLLLNPVRWKMAFRLVLAAPELLEASVQLHTSMAKLINELGLGTKEQPLNNTFIPIISNAARLEAVVSYVATGNFQMGGADTSDKRESG